MKILKIIHGYPPLYNAGSEVYSQSICNELSRSHDVTVLTREENEYLPMFNFRNDTTDGKRLTYINMALGKDGYNHPLVNARFRELVKEIKPDIAHIGHLNHLSIGIIDILHELKIPMVYTLHDFWLMCPRGQFLQRNFDGLKHFELCQGQEDAKCASTCYKMYHSGFDHGHDQQAWTNWIHTRMYAIRTICEKIDLFIAPSQYLRDRFIRDFTIPANKIQYLDYGFPTEYLTPVLPNKGHTDYTFGYIGTHIPAKGVNLLIEAFAKLTGNARLMIWGRDAGQGSMALRKRAADISTRIEFRGEYINKNLADTVFSQVDCIVVPSIWGENSPLVIHEAQACRVPVITSNFGGVAEYVEHQVNGLLFRHRDSNDLAAMMQLAMDNPGFLELLGQKGYLYSEDGNVPDIKDHCTELEKIYTNLILSENGKYALANHA